MADKKKSIVVLAVIAIVLVVAVFGGIYATRNIGKSDDAISAEDASTQLAQLLKKLDVYEGTSSPSAVEYTEEESAADELPDIDTCEVVVEADSALYAEIYSSPEKAGDGTDGWLTEMAEEFNAADYTYNGQDVSIRLRQVNSGQAVDYIASGKAVPDGFTPSSTLWVNMLEASGVGTETVSESLAGNVAGIVLSNDKYAEIVSTYGSVDMMAVTQAVEAGGLKMGYTNPFASTTGLNFLLCTLMRYDSGSPFSNEAVSGFTTFQSNVSLVALTTMQMRTAAEKGSLDGFVMEYQTFINDSTLSQNYTFTPFGYEHDNPLVAVEGTGEDASAILSMFARFCESDEAQEGAKDYGFNQMGDYTCEYEMMDGADLLAAQQLYKENKDAGQDIVCVFVADVSGSMAGEPLNALKESLINSMQYINENNYIGLVSYSSDVTIEVPVAEFDLTQQAKYKGAVESLTESGQTATFNALVVAMDMIEAQMEETPDAKAMVFLLSDGETNKGYSLSQVSEVVSGLGIQVYTIGYNADIDALQSISDINEAACMNASTDDIVYQLKQIFNANL